MPPQRRRALAALIALALPLVAVTACSGTAADPGTLVVLAHAPSGEVRFMQMGSGKITDRVQVGGEPGHVLRDPGRGRVYVTDTAGDSVLVVDVLNRKLTERVRVGREPRFAALAPDGARLYVTLAGENALAIVDTNTLEVVGSVPAGNRPAGVAVSSDGSRVFVGSDGDDAIVSIDASQRRRMSRSMPVSSGVRGGLALSNDGTTLLSGTDGSGAIAAISLGDQQAREVSLAPAADGSATPENLLATPDGRFWLVALSGAEDVVAVPAGGGDPVAISVGEEPSGFAVAPGGRVLVASREGEDLVELDLEKGKATRRIRVGAGHTDVAVFPKTTLDALRDQ